MNCALFGDDPAALPLIEALADSPGHQLLLIGATGLLADRLRTLRPTASLDAHWQDVLTRADCDTVIVCGADPLLLAGVVRLALAGRAVVAFPDPAQQATFAYELAPLGDSDATTRVPVFPLRSTAAFEDLSRRLAAGEVGRVRLIQFARIVHATDAGPLAVIPLPEIHRRLLADIDLIRQVGGDYNRVAVLPSAGTSAGAAAWTVTFAGEGLPEATWTITHGDADADALTIQGERGTLKVSGLAIRDLDTDARRALGRRMLNDVVTARKSPHDTAWTDCVRAFDLLDAAQRSVRRKRMIELQFDGLSERSQFKTQMTAAGCGILSATLLGAILLLIVGAAFDPRDAEQRRSEGAGYVFTAEDFELADKHESRDGLPILRLNAAAIARAQQIAASLPETSTAVIAEASAGDATGDNFRKGAVVQALADAGVPPPQSEPRIVVRPLAGRWFRRLVTAGWVLVFLPLFGFLVLQTLIVLAREK